MDSSLSAKFLDIDAKITNVVYHPKEVLVKFQGRYNLECEFDYHILQREIQQVPKVRDSVGIGEFCLVEDSDCGEWYRGRVVQKRHHSYEVFLMDSGKILAVDETHLASPNDELFQLSPKIICGIFANILPTEEKWAAKAFNYFSSLIGLQIKGSIQAILPQQTFLLDVPKISNDVVELRLGKVVDGDTFHLIVKMLTEFSHESLCKQMPGLLQQKYTWPDSQFCSAGIQLDFQPILNNLQPVLPIGVIEKVKISVAISPNKFYCQLVRHQNQLDELITSMSSYYETVSREKVQSRDNLGILCAARRKSGQWQRGVIQQLLSDNKVKIWFMDFGNYEVVPSEYILKLQPEFISVPMFSFPCTLSCLSDQDGTVRNGQLEEFKEALLRQQAIFALIDLFNSNEQLYCVTIHKFAHALKMENDVVPKCYPLCNTEVSCIRENTQNSNMNAGFGENYSVNFQSDHLSDQMGSPLTIPCKTAEMKIDSVYVAFVVYVLNPSHFWVQTNDHLDEFEALMKKVADVYDTKEGNDKILENLEPGKLCCARYSKDMHFYRAVITQIVNNNVNVYFLDFGNTETVPLFDLRSLLPEFQELPALAMCCSLAYAFPMEDIWTKKETDFFKETVVSKTVTLHVIAKQNDNYIVSMLCMNGSEQSDVLTLLVEAGCAEHWEIKQDPLQKIVNGSDIYCSKRYKNKNIQSKPAIKNYKELLSRKNGQKKQLLNTHIITKKAETLPPPESILPSKFENVSQKTDEVEYYKVYRFQPGFMFDVVCCHIISPGNFLCQIQSKLSELKNLMEQIQKFYNIQKCPYESGQLACIAKHSKDGKWYRAAVVKQVSKTVIDVIFVDYGNQERVLLKDLQAIHPDFLILECQAFRCCLNIVSESLLFDPFDWTPEICHDFRSFISSNGQLSCLICALIFKTPNCLCYIVDLKTPFTSLKQFLLECGHVKFCSFECAQSVVTSFSLCSFYYSSFNVKLGKEEDVCVTYINSPSKFYCQLNRNAAVIDNILKNIPDITKITSHTVQIRDHSLCLAKYFKDGLFYRALASSMDSSDYWLVYFVDFGNTEVVEKKELIPIPNNASELLFTPMQAIECYLSDLHEIDIPAEIKAWFENNCLGKELKAVIVSKESDGKLGMELYDGDLQINRKIKELLKDIKCDQDPNNIKKYSEKCVGNKNTPDRVDKTKITSDVVTQQTEAEKGVFLNQNKNFHVKSRNKIMINLQKQVSTSLKLPLLWENPQPTLQNFLNQRCGSTYEESNTDYFTTQSNELAGNGTEPKLNHFGQEKSHQTRQKYTNLPQTEIRSNSKVWCYISSIVNLLDFCVHRVEDEDKVLQLAEELNEGLLLVEPETPAELEKGDVVLAEYENDCCIYRAFVREVTADELFEVEFIDYGNIATVNAKKIYKIQKNFLNLPRLCIHCFLSKAKCFFSNTNWCTDNIAYFINNVYNQPVMIEFLQQHGQQWEVEIFHNGISLTDELLQKEICFGLQNQLALNSNQTEKQLTITDSETDGNDPDRKAESQNLCEPFKIRPAEIAFPTLRSGQLELAEISHVSRTGDFYVKLVKDATALLDLNEMAAQEVETKFFITVNDIKEGLECLARSKETLEWYRSEVTKKYMDKECMLVLFVDVGKYETVPLREAHRLSQRMRHIPRKAVLCKWIWFENLSNLSFERMVEETKCHEIKILFLRYLEPAFIWEVDILIDGILFLEYWNEISHHTKLERCNMPGNFKLSKPAIDLPIKSNSVLWTQFQKDTCYPGFVTSFTDPSNFSIQLEDSFKTLKSLFKLLSDLPESLPTMPQELIVPGVGCLIQTGSIEKWNRVEVSEVLKDSDTLLLTFIDNDGLSVLLPNSDIHKLKIIPEKLASLPRLTYPCSLFGVTPADGKCWNDEAKLKIQEFLGRQGLTFQVKQPVCGLKLEVNVLCGKSNAADALVTSGYALYSETASSFGSISFPSLHLSNSHILCKQSQSCSQTISGAELPLNLSKKDPQNSGLRWKWAGNKNPRNSSSKKRKGKKGQVTLLPSDRSNNENLPQSDENYFGQYCLREQLKHSFSSGTIKCATQVTFEFQEHSDPESKRNVNTCSQER